jgi:putative lipoprotein (rSAM/lipoprotein system)
MPALEYEIRGIVTDKINDKPINNIRIIREGIAPFDSNDTLYTDLQGKYRFLFCSIDADFHLKIEDIDGKANDGEFESQEIDIKITSADRVKNKKEECKVTQEKFVKTQNIELEKKEIFIPAYGIPKTTFKP